MYRLIILFALLIPATMVAQSFQKAIFRHNTQDLSDVLVAGQRIKVFVPGENGYLRKFKGKLHDVRHDSIFLKRRNEIMGFALADVEEIRYRSKTARQFILGLLILGSVLFIVTFFLGAASFVSASTSVSQNMLGGLIGVSIGMLLMAPLVSIFSKRWIEKPAETRRIEIVETNPLQQLP